MTWDEKITKLPGTAALKSMHHTAELVDELELRPGLVIPVSDNPDNGIEAGKVHFTLRLTKTPNEVVQLEGYSAPLEQISTNEEGQPVSPLEPGKYWIYRTGNYAEFHPDDWGKAFTRLECVGSGHNLSRQMYGQTNDSIKGLHAQLKAVGEAMEAAGIGAIVSLKLKVSDFATLDNNYPAEQFEGWEAWVVGERKTYESDGIAWNVRTGGAAVEYLTATMTQPMVTEGVTQEPVIAIAIQFSEAVDPLTVNHVGDGTGTFELRNDDTMTFIFGQLSTSDNITFNLELGGNLAGLTNFRVMLSNQIQSADGTKNYTGQNFSFQTNATELFSNDNDTYFLYRFNESTGIVATDETGRANLSMDGNDPKYFDWNSIVPAQFGNGRDFKRFVGTVAEEVPIGQTYVELEALPSNFVLNDIGRLRNTGHFTAYSPDGSVRAARYMSGFDFVQKRLNLTSNPTSIPAGYVVYVDSGNMYSDFSDTPQTSLPNLTGQSFTVEALVTIADLMTYNYMFVMDNFFVGQASIDRRVISFAVSAKSDANPQRLRLSISTGGGNPEGGAHNQYGQRQFAEPDMNTPLYLGVVRDCSDADPANWKVRFYIDGVLDAEIVDPYGTRDYTFGNGRIACEWFGIVDEIRFSLKARTAAEIAAVQAAR